MATESKKLQLSLEVIDRIQRGDEDFPDEYLKEAVDAARIAHEQREVIRQLYERLRAYHSLPSHRKGVRETCTTCKVMAAAAPFMED